MLMRSLWGSIFINDSDWSKASIEGWSVSKTNKYQILCGKVGFFCKEEKFFTVVCTCAGIFSYIFSSQECSDQ